MAIEKVDFIPSKLSKVTGQREQIRADITEALEMGITKFEFVGDVYNYKYLPQYAKDEGERMARRMVWDWAKDCKMQLLNDQERSGKGFRVYVDAYKMAKDIFVISSFKDGDKRRVFCNIRVDGLKEKVETETKRAILEAREKLVWNGKMYEHKGRLK